MSTLVGGDGAAGEGPASKGGTTTTSQSGTAVVLQIAHESGLEIGGGQEKIKTKSHPKIKKKKKKTTAKQSKKTT